LAKDADMAAVSSRLDAVLRLILDYQREASKSDITIGDQILVMMDAGLGQGEAGKILGVLSNQIPSYLKKAKNQTLLKKLKGKKKGNLRKSGIQAERKSREEARQENSA
jgi:hypothetical protein